MQKVHPIAFERRKLEDLERLYSIYDKEILAIMHTLAKFRQYLVGSKFIVKTCHNDLCYFLEKKDLKDNKNGQVRSKLMILILNIQYIKGKNNVVADALSRKPTCSLMKITKDWKVYLFVEYFKNKLAYALTDIFIQDYWYKIINNIILCKDKIFLVPESILKEKILKDTLDILSAGHQGLLSPGSIFLSIFLFTSSFLSNICSMAT